MTFFAVPILILVALVARRRRGRFAAAMIVALVFVAVGLTIAVLTSAYGGILVAAALPFGLAAGTRRDDAHRQSILTLALVASLPLALIIVSIGPFLGMWSSAHGLPLP